MKHIFPFFMRKNTPSIYVEMNRFNSPPSFVNRWQQVCAGDENCVTYLKVEEKLIEWSSETQQVIHR